MQLCKDGRSQKVHKTMALAHIKNAGHIPPSKKHRRIFVLWIVTMLNINLLTYLLSLISFKIANPNN